MDLSIFLFILGIQISIVQKLPDKGNFIGYVDIGNYAYIIGFIFIGYRLRILYYLVYQKKDANKN